MGLDVSGWLENPVIYSEVPYVGRSPRPLAESRARQEEALPSSSRRAPSWKGPASNLALTVGAVGTASKRSMSIDITPCVLRG